MMEGGYSQLPTMWGDGSLERLGWFNRERVREARVMVVGAGALGNEALKSLALFGVGEITVVDFDTVEESNLTRSVLFRSRDAGRNKVDVVVEALRDINPEVRVRAIVGDITHDIGLGLIASMDVIVGCLDSRWARYILNRYAMRCGVAWVDGGIEGLDGTARLFQSGENCYACNMGEVALSQMARRRSCSSIVKYEESKMRAATTPIVASIIGAVEAQEAMKIIHREELEAGGCFTSLCGRVFCYEGAHMTPKIAEFRAWDDECTEHERWDDVRPISVTVDATLERLREEISRALSLESVEIVLRNHTFVEYLIKRVEGCEGCEGCEELKIPVYLPSFALSDFVAQDERLSGAMQHEINIREWREIAPESPFEQLTLSELGFPDWDIIEIRSNNKSYHLELLSREAK